MASFEKELAVYLKDDLIYYKLRHKPTGLFYRPTSYRYKSNVSKSGKLYLKKPELILREWELGKYRDSNMELKKIILDEWEIITYRVKIQGIEEIPKDKEKPKNERKGSNVNSTISSIQGEILESIKNATKRKT